jgi:hypothetical protein
MNTRKHNELQPRYCNGNNAVLQKYSGVSTDKLLVHTQKKINGCIVCQILTWQPSYDVHKKYITCSASSRTKVPCTVANQLHKHGTNRKQQIHLQYYMVYKKKISVVAH